MFASELKRFHTVAVVSAVACLLGSSMLLTAQPLIDCGEGEPGDSLRRGFYIPYYPGETLERVELFFGAYDPGQYTFSLTIRQSAYDGALVGESTATAEVPLYPNYVTGNFVFDPALTVTPGSTLTFALGIIEGPVPDPDVYYSVNNSLQSCPAVETSGTSAPLDELRRHGVMVRVFGQPAAGPALAANGAFNAASFRPPQVPGGAIAQGSLFSLFGSGLGSTLGVPLEFRLRTSLAGISIQVSGDKGSVAAVPLFSNGTQVNALMPSDAPVGPVEITLSFNGRESEPMSAEVVPRSVGIFTARSVGYGTGIIQNFESPESQPINSLRYTARPGQIVTMWATGLGAIEGNDRDAPPIGNVTEQLEITVGGVPADVIRYSGRSGCCAGLDQIIFDVPMNAPTGCYVPVMVRTTDNNITSNVVTMAISADGVQGCVDAMNPAVSGLYAESSPDSQPLGSIIVGQSAISLAVAPGTVVEAVVERGLAEFEQTDQYFFDRALSLPPLGSCTVSHYRGEFPLDQTDVLALMNSVPLTGIDAGEQVRLFRGRDGAMIPLAETVPGAYGGMLGGGVPLPGFPDPQPEFVEPGSYSADALGQSGGVGPFTATMNIPQPIVWENPGEVTRIDRTQPLTLRWSGGNPASQAVYLGGISIDENEGVAGAVVCLAPASDGQFTIPADILGTLPASTTDAMGLPGGVLGVGVVPIGPGVGQFTAAGLTRGVFQYMIVNGIPADVE